MATTRQAGARTSRVLSVQDLVRKIEEGPHGPKTVVVFDFDGTLIAGYSAAAFFQAHLRKLEYNAFDLAEAGVAIWQSAAGAIEMQDLLNKAVGKWKGRKEADLLELGEKIFDKTLSDKVYPEMVTLLMAHRRVGHTIAIASSATRFQVEPTAKFLGIENVMTSTVEVKRGVLTGRMLEPQMWGKGKADAVRAFVKSRKARMADTWFYADGGEEIGLMQAVGHPVPTNPARELAAAAQQHGWDVLRHSSRGSTTPELLARTATGLMSLFPLLYTGIGWGLLNRDKRKAANLSLPMWADSVMLAAGVKLRVTGRKHLEAHRPAIFIFNHRNLFDAFFVGALVRTDLAWVGKAELKKNPISAMLSRLVPVAFVERTGGSPEEAAKALEPVAKMVKEGCSIMIAPEGTRTRDMTVPLGPFKKGAFHMARSLGIPLVPIVIRNALDVAGRDAVMLRSGTVDIAVLPPVYPTDWTEKNTSQKAEEVRQMFLDQLENWPDADK
ncbi:MAG: HAD-IB family hydrolase [Novosphingobium sp.]